MESIKKKYKKYGFKKSILNKPTKELCKPPTRFTLQPPQEFIGELMKSNQSGVLIFHKIGSGKTCTAIRVAENWKGKKNIVVVLPASLISNFRDELRSLCAENSYLSQNDRKTLSAGCDELTRKSIIKKSDEKINKFYNIYSYNKFIALIDNKSLKMKNTLLIIDEVQNMISETGVYYKKIYNFIKKSPSDLKVVLLSATPIFDKPVEIALTLNLLPLKKMLPTGNEFNDTFIEYKGESKGVPMYNFINQDRFKESIRGFVSYYKGMPDRTFPRSILHIVKCEMESFQYRSYQLVLKKEIKRNTKNLDLLRVPNSFFISSRTISNIAYPNRKTNKKGFESWEGSVLKLKNLKKYSIKFYKILKKIKSAEGKIFIYSNFLEYGGIKPLAKVLEANGYVDFKNRDITTKRKPKFFAIWSGDESHEYKQQLKYEFNLKKSPLKILLGSPAIKEGVSLKRVRQVHILEPYWNYSRFSQIVGRALRYCSHSDLPKLEQEVEIFLYLSQRPKESTYRNKSEILDKLSIDRYINYLAVSKQYLINQFEQTLKENALDCLLYQNVNQVDCDV